MEPESDTTSSSSGDLDEVEIQMPHQTDDDTRTLSSSDPDTEETDAPHRADGGTVQLFDETARNTVFTFTSPIPSPRSAGKRPRSHSTSPSCTPSPSPRRVITITHAAKTVSREMTVNSNDCSEEHPLTADVDDDGKVQKTLFSFFQKESLDERRARLKREAERDAKRIEEKLELSRLAKEREQARLRENGRIRVQIHREREREKKIASGWEPRQKQKEERAKKMVSNSALLIKEILTLSDGNVN
jgi:hypothetical protein